MSVSVNKPGLLSSFQDLGRWGHQHLGVSVTGVMDAQSHRLANLIVGNTTDCATLEVTILGPTLVFEKACCICLTGADMGTRHNGKPVPRYRPLIMQAGDTLVMNQAIDGARGYLAVYGGFDLPSVMASQSTYLRAGFGGWQGRALKRDDNIPINVPLMAQPAKLKTLADHLADTRIYLPSILGQYTGRKTLIRLIRSDQWSAFTPESCAAMLSADWRISPDSERMGYRLEGPTLALVNPKQMISEATSFGTIQVPSGGQPIVLMADRQTSGGYPKIGTVATIDLSILAQKKPGDRIRFTPIDVQTAQKLDQDQQSALAELANSLVRLRQTLAHTHQNL
jgi:antagonist of KipI